MITRRDIREFWQATVRWWWLVVVASALAGGVAAYTSDQQAPIYLAQTTLRVGTTFESTQPDSNQVSLTTSLAQSYAAIVRREAILAPVVTQLQLPFSWQLLSDRMVQTNLVPSAGLLEIIVLDTDPARAAKIANAIGAQLISTSPTAPEKIATEQQALAQQLSESEARITLLKQQITDQTAERQRMSSAAELAEANARLTQLGISLEQEQSTQRTLLTYQQSGSVTTLDFFEQATPPATPLPSKRPVVIATAMLSGLLLALCAVYALTMLEQRWYITSDIARIFGMPNLGMLPAGYPSIAAHGPFRQRRSRAAFNAYTNLLLNMPEHGIRSLLISSPVATPERTNFSIDLAELFARAGHRVVIVDTDEAGELQNHPLLTMPRHGVTRWMCVPNQERGEFWLHLHSTAIPNVLLMHGPFGADHGSPGMHPELRWPRLVELLGATADLVIFDGPAALAGTDAAMLAAEVDGVVLALRPDHDSRTMVHQSRKRLLHRKGSRLLGAVLVTPQRRHSEQQAATIPATASHARHQHGMLPAFASSCSLPAPDEAQQMPSLRNYQTRALRVVDDQELLMSLLS